MKNRIRTRIQKLKTGWYIWMFPVIALAISGWIFYDYYSNLGPRIRILFDDAGGIQAEKTKIRFRGVAIGTVKDVYLSKDQKDVVAEVLLRKDAEDIAVDGSKFSLVTPKVTFQGVSGLETLFEGTYIAVLPGSTEGRKRIEFKAQSSTSIDPHDDTSVFLLETDNVESVSIGDSITYRGVKLGAVTKLAFSKDATTILLHINIENRYTRLIRSNTIFWRKVGVQAKLGLFNSEIKINSLDSIMNGGIEIATPTNAGPPAKALQKFPLYATGPKEYGNWRPKLEL